ncbi:hypothetical protein F5Y17DRAFT_439527 [Xylariaceae sp. FL0594]|nr:hypothetical protein F5Y17DRAFT_439527 [Xylariaceae sp. FL0594]
MREHTPPFPQAAAKKLARITWETLYGGDEEREREMLVRDEYLGTEVINGILKLEFDYYGVTFDHLVPATDPDPEVLMLNITELETEDPDNGHNAMGFAFARRVLRKELADTITPDAYPGREGEVKRVLAVPRCCQKRRGTTDRRTVNAAVTEREEGV